jgi:hypothetical protein
MTAPDEFGPALGFKKGAILPYAALKYQVNLLPADDPKTVKLHNCIQKYRDIAYSAAYPDGTHPHIPFSMMFLATSPDGPHIYAGVDHTVMYFSASLLKVGVMFAAFELRESADRLASTLTIPPDTNTPEQQQTWLVNALNQAFKQGLAHSSRARQLDSLTPNTPRYGSIFSFDPTRDPFAVDFNSTSPTSVYSGSLTGNGAFRAAAAAQPFSVNLNKMITVSGDFEASQCIQALGFTYINAALANGGFFRTGDYGIWISGDYDLLEVRPVATMNDGDGKLVMDTQTMCRVFALIELNKLVDQLSSEAMHDLLAGTLTSDPPWITRDDQDNTITTLPYTVLTNKLGVDHLGRPGHLGQNVYSECSVLQWHTSDTSTVNKLSALGLSRKIVVCWQNLQENQTKTFSGIRDMVENIVAEFLG